jgi:hypothetical protein
MWTTLALLDADDTLNVVVAELNDKTFRQQKHVVRTRGWSDRVSVYNGNAVEVVGDNRDIDLMYLDLMGRDISVVVDCIESLDIKRSNFKLFLTLCPRNNGNRSGSHKGSFEYMITELENQLNEIYPTQLVRLKSYRKTPRSQVMAFMEWNINYTDAKLRTTWDYNLNHVYEHTDGSVYVKRQLIKGVWKVDKKILPVDVNVKKWNRRPSSQIVSLRRRVV